MWESWRPKDGSPLETFTILTTDPNEVMKPIHNRMPVILEPKDYDRWLDAGDPIRVVRFSGPFLTFGAVEHTIEGVPIKVYSPAKTVADCFKFRSKVGTELAIQSLQACFREKRASMDELWEAAKICRVANVMRPYMESLS